MKIELLKNLKQDPDNVKAIVRFAAKPFGMFLISGPSGSGKTFASKAIYEANTSYCLPYRDDEEAILTSEYNLALDWKESLKNPLVDLDKYLKTKLLIIDNFGSKDPTPTYLEYLFYLIDHRWENGHSLGTVIVINRVSEEIKASFGSSFFSRIASGSLVRLSNQNRIEAIATYLEAQGNAFDGKDLLGHEKSQKSLGWAKEEEIEASQFSWKKTAI